MNRTEWKRLIDARLNSRSQNIRRLNSSIWKYKDDTYDDLPESDEVIIEDQLNTLHKLVSESDPWIELWSFK